MAEATASKFVSLDDTIESFIEEHENPNTVKKTKREVALLTVFLQTKGETREIAEIPPVELNELLSEFILSVRTKEGQEYEPSLLRGMVASFERHLKVPLGRKFIGLFPPNSVAEYRVLFIFPQKTEQQTFHPNIF